MQLIAILTFFSIQLFARIAAKETCPLVLGHRGAPGLYPEDTAIGYEKAVEFGADFIECDIQVTKDLQLVCSHDQWIKDVCNVANFEEFSNRLTTFWDTPYGDIIDNFFIIDFEVAELKQLLRKQTTKGLNPNFDHKYSFVTFDEFVAIAKSKGAGIAPEIKIPNVINKVLAQRGTNITIEDLVLNALTKHGYTGSDDKCLLQCFELSTITEFHRRSEVKLVFHLETLDQTNLENLQKIKNEGVYAIGLDKELIVPRDDKGNCGAPNYDLIETIHNMGMKIFPWTFKNELSSLCWDYLGDVQNELEQFFQLKIDGFFADYPNTVSSFLDRQDCLPPYSSDSEKVDGWILPPFLTFIKGIL